MTRAPTLADNTALPAAFEARTGDLIYDGLVQGFRVRANAFTQRPLSACCLPATSLYDSGNVTKGLMCRGIVSLRLTGECAARDVASGFAMDECMVLY